MEINGDVCVESHVGTKTNENDERDVRPKDNLFGQRPMYGGKDIGARRLGNEPTAHNLNGSGKFGERYGLATHDLNGIDLDMNMDLVFMI